MFVPTGYFASAGVTPVLPPLISDASVYYSADQNTDWTDLTTNGYDGTVGTVGSGGGSSITHNAGAQPYWQFTCTDPTVERKHLDTGYAHSVSSDYTIMCVVSFDDVTTNNWQGFAAFSDPAGNPSFNIGQNTTQAWYHSDRGASSGNNLFTYAGTTLSTSTWYMVTIVGNSSGIYLYTNNVLDGSDTSNGVTYVSSETITLGRDATLVANYKNQGKIAAWAWFDKELNSTERTELYDYYNNIYSF